MSSTLTGILEAKIVAILRGWDTAETQEIIGALSSGGIRNVEVTITSPHALKSIEKARIAFDDHIRIGAGTVMDEDAAAGAIESGASFIISPILDLATIKKTKAMGAVSIPGAFSPTEIAAAHREGADLVKIFPATQGPEFIKNILGPLPDILLMPTGGVHLGNIPSFLRAGAAAFGVGTALVGARGELTDEALRRIEENARKYVQAVK